MEHQTVSWRTKEASFARRTLRPFKQVAASVVENWQRRAAFRLVQQKNIADIPLPPLSDIHSFRAEHFPKSGPLPWLDRPNALEAIAEKLQNKEISETEAEYCRKWVNDGYVVVPKAFTPSNLDEIWGAYEKALRAGHVTFEEDGTKPGDPFPPRSLNPHRAVPELNQVLFNASLVKLIHVLLGQTPVPFQTLAFYKGSGQLAHSDFVHMTTYPVGYLAATWTAFEDIHEDSGPLIYYPSSHRLPYSLSKEAGIAVGEYPQKGRPVYHEKYEPMVQKMIAENNLKPHLFLPKKGDTFIWHANLLHGGLPRQNALRSRKSVVCHYFTQGVLCYHDLSEAMASYSRAYNYQK